MAKGACKLNLRAFDSSVIWIVNAKKTLWSEYLFQLLNSFLTELRWSGPKNEKTCERNIQICIQTVKNIRFCVRRMCACVNLYRLNFLKSNFGCWGHNASKQLILCFGCVYYIYDVGCVPFVWLRTCAKKRNKYGVD